MIAQSPDWLNWHLQCSLPRGKNMYLIKQDFCVIFMLKYYSLIWHCTWILKLPGPSFSHVWQDWYHFHLSKLHTKQNWSRFGSRSGVIPKYLIQHQGGPFFGSGIGTKIMAPPRAKNWPHSAFSMCYFEWNGAQGHQIIFIVANGSNIVPPPLCGVILKKWCQLYRFLPQSCYVWSILPMGFRPWLSSRKNDEHITTSSQAQEKTLSFELRST